MATDNKGEDMCMSALAAIGLTTPTILTHTAVMNIDEMTSVIANLPGNVTNNVALVKNVFLKGKKGEMILMCALSDSKTDLKLVAKAAGVVSVRMTPAELMVEVIGVGQGSVTPLALVNDTAKKVIVVLDSRLLSSDKSLLVHPCRNDKSVIITPTELTKYIDFTGHKVIPVDFSCTSDEVDPSGEGEDSHSTQQTHPKVKAEKPKKEENKGETKLGIDIKKSDDFAGWYSQVITKGEMVEYYDVSGCYVIRPWAYHIWDIIKRYFTDKIEEMGVEECSFPMFVSKAALEKEKDHVEGFAPEVAWVTKAGDTDLQVPIAIRPTSETVMYPYFAKWIRSHRDLPLRLNQWCNVVRWEFSHPTPFIRNREFLWQEGHCAWETLEECDAEVRKVLDFYAAVYTDLLAVPVVQGKKTEKEKFAGGYYTTTVETFIAAVGRGCQGATSHNLGQNFGKMFGISYEDPNAKPSTGESTAAKLIPFQNSWGLTTRSIGVMTMVHGDDTGLVLPPRVAQIQVVIVPVGITAKTTQEERDTLLTTVTELQGSIKASGIRCKTDLRDRYSPAWRFNYWEMKGVPMRIELGFKEMKERKLVLAIRHDHTKVDIEWSTSEALCTTLHALLDTIHNDMLHKATEQRRAKTIEVTEWSDFVPALNNKCLILAPWCESQECEDNVKKYSAEESKQQHDTTGNEDERAPSMGAKSLCIPFDQPRKGTDVGSLRCICRGCTKAAKMWVLWGRSF